MIKPYSKGVSFVQNGDKICFTLKENGAYVLEIGSYHQLLYIFYHKPIAAHRNGCGKKISFLWGIFPKHLRSNLP